jgi:hypothetical protein
MKLGLRELKVRDLEGSLKMMRSYKEKKERFAAARLIVNLFKQRTINELGRTLRLRDQQVQHLQNSLQEASIAWQELQGLSNLRYIRSLFLDNRISELNEMREERDSLQRRVSSQEADLVIKDHRIQV